MSRSSRVSRLVRFLVFQLFEFFPARATVNHYDMQLLLKEIYDNAFFVLDINLQDPLIYADLSTLILQPAFV